MYALDRGGGSLQSVRYIFFRYATNSCLDKYTWDVFAQIRRYIASRRPHTRRRKMTGTVPAVFFICQFFLQDIADWPKIPHGILLIIGRKFLVDG